MHAEGVGDYHLSSRCARVGALSRPVRRLGSGPFAWSYGMLRAGSLCSEWVRQGMSRVQGTWRRHSCWAARPGAAVDEASSLALGAGGTLLSHCLWGLCEGWCSRQWRVGPGMTVCTHLAPGRWKPFAKMCLVLACVAPQILPLPKNLQERKRGSFSFSFFPSLSPTQLKYSSRHLI